MRGGRNEKNRFAPLIMTNSPVMRDPVPFPAGASVRKPSGRTVSGRADVGSFQSAVEQGLHRAARVWDKANAKVRHAADTCPMCLIGTFLGVGFAAGVLLRIWRSSRYE